MRTVAEICQWLEENCQCGTPPAHVIQELIAAHICESQSGGTGPGSSCAEPSFVEVCNLQDLIDAINNQQDFEYVKATVCLAGTWQCIVTPIINGVEGTPVTTDLGIPCDQPLPIDPQVTKVSYCNEDTDTTWEKVCLFTFPDPTDPTNVVETVLREDDTGVSCAEDTEQIFCRKWKSLVVGLDNTGTLFSESHEFTITNSDGSTTVINATPQTGWTPQLNHWVTLYQAEYPDLLVEARCNLAAGCGGLLAPNADVNFNLMRWRYLNITACPGQIVPVRVEVTGSSNPARIGLVLDLEYYETPEQRGYVCMTCDGGEGVLKYNDGTDVPAADLPICTIGCDEQFEAPPTPSCTSSIEEGCDNVNEPDDNTNWVSPITRVVKDCGDGELLVNYYQPDPLDPTALTDYTLVGDFVDCNSGQTPDLPSGCDNAPLSQICPSPTVREECDCSKPEGFLVTSGEPEGEAPITFPFAASTINLTLDGSTFGTNPAQINDVAGLVAFLNTNLGGFTFTEDVNGDITISDGAPHVELIITEGAITLYTYAWPAQEQFKDALRTKDCNSDKILETLEEIATDCTACQPIVDTDTVCNDVDQTVDGVLILANRPIIRKVITTFVADGCDCIEESQVTRFFNFEDPVQEFTVAPAFIGTCDSTTETVTRCDRNGMPIQVTTITVFNDDGTAISQEFADLNGEPIPDPLLPLSICNPDVEPIAGCVNGRDGILHLQYDAAGNPDYSVSTFTYSDTGENQALGSDSFTPGDCNKLDCVIDRDKYCYDVSSFAFTCPSSTIEIDSVVTDLCVGGTGVIPTTGDILTNGGIRSEDEPTRHPNALNNTGAGYDPSLITSDALNVVANPASIGGATHPGNTTVKVLFSGDLFGLSGTAPLITLDGTWVVGSGIGVGVYDPVQNLILPMGSGETPATYDLTNFGVEIYNGGTGTWGGVSGPHTWTVDTSGVADLSQLIIYTVVINPTGDELQDLRVNGQAPMAQSCDIDSQETLIIKLTEVTGNQWFEEDGLICVLSDVPLGPLTCGATSVDPVISIESEQVSAPYVAIHPCDLEKLLRPTWIYAGLTCYDDAGTEREARVFYRADNLNVIEYRDAITNTVISTPVECSSCCDN